MTDKEFQLKLATREIEIDEMHKLYKMPNGYERRTIWAYKKANKEVKEKIKKALIEYWAEGYLKPLAEVEEIDMDRDYVLVHDLYHKFDRENEGIRKKRALEAKKEKEWWDSLSQEEKQKIKQEAKKKEYHKKKKIEREKREKINVEIKERNKKFILILIGVIVILFISLLLLKK